jgi:hypothetical protein
VIPKNFQENIDSAILPCENTTPVNKIVLSCLSRRNISRYRGCFGGILGRKVLADFQFFLPSDDSKLARKGGMITQES